MQIQYNGGRITHVQSDIGLDLIARKLAVEVKPAPKPTPNTTWELCLGAQVDQPPYIKAHCSTCAQIAFCGGETAPAMKFLHCRVVETVPPVTAKQYVKMYRDWKNGKEPRPSSVSPEQREIEQKRIETLKARRIIQI